MDDTVLVNVSISREISSETQSPPVKETYGGVSSMISSEIQSQLIRKPPQIQEITWVGFIPKGLSLIVKNPIKIGIL